MNIRFCFSLLIVIFAATACAGPETTLNPGNVEPALPTILPSPEKADEDLAPPIEAGEENEPVLEIEAQQTMEPMPTDTEVSPLLPVLGPAPSWENEVWINSETPLPLEELRGKVVLLEFWTFG